MKKIYITSALLASLVFLGGCSSDRRAKGRSYDEPTHSIETNKIYADMGKFSPDPGYNADVRNRNNYIILSLEMKALNTKSTLLPDNINDSYMWMTLQNRFEASKRFSVISADQSDKAKNAGLKLKVVAQVLYAEKMNAQRKAIGCEVRMAFVGVNADGVQEFQLDTIGGASEFFEKSFTGKYTVDGNVSDRLIMKCVDKCFNKVYPALCKRYPVSGNVESVRSNSKYTFLKVDRGTEDGIQKGMPFVIGYTDADKNEIFVARGMARDVQTNTAQIVIDEWNSDEPDAVSLCKSKIAAKDKSFYENMFVVSKYR